MRLSTSTSFYRRTLNGEYILLKESVRRCKSIGFNVLDVSFCNAIYSNYSHTELAKDNWQELIEDLRNEAVKLGVEFSQSHPVFLPGHINDHSVEKQEQYQEMMKRSILASSILGVKWAVMHPLEERLTKSFDTETNIKENMEQHASIVELAMKHNVGIAFENMIEGSNTKRRFSSHAGELAALIDAFDDSRVGACWDFGHGNFLYKDQRIALRTLGKRLKAIHVNDNHGNEDQHMFPFHGSVDWHSVIPVLTEIEYEGDFTFEIKEFLKLPDHIKDHAAKVKYEIGKYCLSLA
jgi:L-ribulose-5-phosphate 3-epimerase